MDLKLKGKTALITGSTKGIGKAIATVMASEGANVVINGRDSHTVNHVVKELQEKFSSVSVEPAPFDLTSEESMNQLFNVYTEVDILVNNMGIFKPMNYFDISDADWQTFINTNVMVGNRLSQYYLPGMLKRNFGRIIFIASEEAIMPSGEMPQLQYDKNNEFIFI